MISHKIWRTHICLEGMKPRNRSGAGQKRKRMKVLRAGLAAAGEVSSWIDDFEVWSGGFDVKAADGKSCGSGCRVDLFGERCSNWRSSQRRFLMF